jgi:hypothetical protein
LAVFAVGRKRDASCSAATPASLLEHLPVRAPESPRSESSARPSTNLDTRLVDFYLLPIGEWTDWYGCIV